MFSLMIYYNSRYVANICAYAVVICVFAAISRLIYFIIK